MMSLPKSPLERLLAGEQEQEEAMMSTGTPGDFASIDNLSPNLAQSQVPVQGASAGSTPQQGPQSTEPQEESQLQRLERLAAEMQQSRSKELEDANRRQMYQDMISGVNSNLGLIVGGAQAMNTKAAVQAPRAGEIKQRDLAGEVERRYKGDQAALMEKYKALLKAQQDAAEMKQRKADKEEDRAFRKDMLNVSRGDKSAMFDQGEYRRVTDRIQSVAQNYENDTVVKKFKEQDLALGQVADIVTQMQEGNQVAAAGLGAKMAKAMGEVGALTEQDVNRYIQAKSLGRNVKDRMMLYIAGEPSELTTEDIKGMAQMMNEGAKRKIYPLQDKYFSRASNYAKQAGISPEEVSDMMGFTNVKTIQRNEDQKQPKNKQPARQLDSKQIQNYAEQYGLDYNKAEAILKSRMNGR